MSAFTQRSFAGGEVAPDVWARQETTKRQTGLKSCLNFIVQRHGGLTNRSGTQYCGLTRYGTSTESTLIPFEFARGDTVLIEAGEYYFYFWVNGVLVTIPTAAAYSGLASYIPGDLVTSGGMVYYCIYPVTGTAPPNATYWALLGVAGTTYEISTPYAGSELGELYFSQSADVMVFAHPSHPPTVLSRFANYYWTFADLTTTPSITYPTNLNAAQRKLLEELARLRSEEVSENKGFFSKVKENFK